MMIDHEYELAKEEIAQALRDNWTISRESFELLKRSVSRRHSLTRVPSNPEILRLLDAQTRELARSSILLKATRSASGVVVVAAMTAPLACPHGSCLYCPGGPDRNTPQSYTGQEPAAMRAISNQFDPRAQVTQRLRQLEEIGHTTEKVELIIMGGTFPSFPLDYQRWFIKECLDALNGYHSSSLEEAKAGCVSGRRRNVALTVETRPDYCREPHIDVMLEMGVTRVEIGLQSVYDDVIRSVRRGHTVEDSVSAIRIVKDSGLKSVVHMMPGLPGSDLERDVKAFKILFEDDRFKPDMLKIYPTLVVGGTGLEDLYRRGLYTPLSDIEATEVVAKVLEMAPRWVRVMRVQRDIPAHQILAGPKRGNLRELAARLLADKGLTTSEIRGREVGLSGGLLPGEQIEMKRTYYSGSLGLDVFLEFTGMHSDRLVAYLRLRKPSAMTHRSELTDGSAVVRELKVLGRATPLGEVWPESKQHRGHGAQLMAEAERIAKCEWGAPKLFVTSALGTKEYYHRLGYADEGPYVSKALQFPSAQLFYAVNAKRGRRR